MTELWLKFKNENGEPKRILVEGEKFLIGRTPDNNLQIPLSNLSRQHAQIQRFADVFIISDCGSSNGTTLNDQNLENPIALKNKDKVNLGEAVEIEIEIISDKENAGEGDGNDGAGSGGSSAGGNKDEEKAVASAAGGSGTGKGNSGSSDKGSVSFGFLILAPILGVCILLVIVGVILLAGGKKEPEVGYQHNNYNYSSSDDNENIDSPTKEEKNTPEKTESPTPTATPGGSTSPEGSTTPVPATPTPGQTGETSSTPKAPTDAEKINGNSASFLRRIAQGDPSAFLTDGQIAIVSQKVDQFKNSSALADNIKNARKNAAEIQRMAASKDIKPQFLVNLALTKLGNQRGDVVAAASQVLDSLSNIIKTFGAEFANECLLIVAALSNNTKAESLQTAAGILGKQFPFDRVRSLWFFKDNGKLSNEQFDYAIKFLAIGTITQNPKSFGVQADELKL